MWRNCSISELCDVTIGATPSRRNPEYWNGEHPWVTVSELNGGIVTATRERITDLGVANSSSKLIKAGTLLFSFKLSIGKMGFAGVDLYTNEAIAAFTIRDESLLNKRFLYYFLMAADSLAPINVAAKGRLLNKSALQKLRIPHPPLSEQRRIVDILDQAERLRRLRAKADAKAAHILPALFIKMFGDPATNPMGWPVCRLGDVTDQFISGGTPSTKVGGYWKGDVPWITGADIKDEVVVVGRKWITQEAIDSSATNVVPKGAVLLVTRTGVGRIARAGVDIAISQDLTGIVLKAGTHPDYVTAAIRQKMSGLLGVQQGAIIKGVLRSDVKKLEIPLPSLSVQRKFANLVADVSKFEANRSKSHLQLETLFRTSLHRAFTGELIGTLRDSDMKDRRR